MATTGRGSGESPANVSRFLKGVDFPAAKQDLVKHAQQNHAERQVIDLIQKMDERQYDSMADVMKAYGSEPHSTSGRSESRSESRSQSKSHQQHK